VKLCDRVVRHLARRFWRQATTYQYQKTFPLRASAQEEFTRKYFLPMLTTDMHVIDLGCADGWHTLIVAPFVKKITAYDLNSRFIETASQLAAESHVENCNFLVADVTSLEIDRIDAAICAGLFTCLSKQEVVSVLQKLFGAMPTGSPLLLKDTLTLLDSDRGESRFLSRTRGAFYRTTEYWHQLVINQGFMIQQCEVIEQTNEQYLSKMMVAVRV